MDSLYDMLLDLGVQATFADKLRDDGWTMELFAMSASSIDKFESELQDILGELYDITTPVQRSALKAAWKRCQSSTSSPSSSALPQGSVLAEQSTTPSSWSETFPPKCG